MNGSSAPGAPNAGRPSAIEAGLEGFVPAAERTRAAVRQLIRLRWLAICGVLGVVVISHMLLRAIQFPIALYLIAGAMAAANVGFEITSRRLDAKPVSAAEHHAYVQIGWDIVSLALLAHFSGGVENPFLLYLVFHVVLASMLMGERQTYIVAIAASTVVAGIFLLEGYGLVGHYHLLLLPPRAAMVSSYHAGICAALMSTFMVTAYLSNSIMRKVRRAETQLLAQNQFLREAEERLRIAAAELQQSRYHAIQQERMAAIGQMAAGIAHEVSNPLTSLYSLVQVLSSSPAGDEQTTARLALMQQSIERISKIVRQIVDYGRPISSEDWLYGDLGKIILDTLQLLRYDRRAQGVEMTTDLDPLLPRTMIIEHQMQQVFMNIALNALDAMNGRGRLAVRAGQNNGSIEVVFTDTGEGMTRDEIQHIFEPYYTTKAARFGTGLGLALSYNIIRKHGGTILVQSEKGKGSTFAVSIPLRGPQGDNGATGANSGR
jgi:signal transduction histidine kinase